jgi:Leucine-rich repeat (LRR) protein
VLQKILQGCKLASLDVSFCTGLFQADKTVKYLTNITRLNASGCTISESTLGKILETVVELRELDVSYNDVLKEQWLLNLINNANLAKNLRVLNVNHCKGISSKVVQALLQARVSLTVYAFCPQ